MIATLTAISKISARMEKNLKIIAAHRQPKEGDNPISKMNDMAMTIEELRNAATAINDATKLSLFDPKHYDAMFREAEVL